MKSTLKRFLSLVLCMCMVMALLPNVTMTAFAATSGTVTGLADENIGLSFTGDADDAWSANGTSIIGAATSTGGTCSDTSYKSTLTITNKKSTTATLSFDYSIEQNSGKIQVDGTEVSSGASFTKELATNESVKVYIQSGSTSAATKITLTNVVLVSDVNATATFVPAENGSYTVDGKLITEEYSNTQSSMTAYQVVATPADGYQFMGWYDVGVLVSAEENPQMQGIKPCTTEMEVIDMAKDGTYRGGRRVKAGSKPDALADKIMKGAPAKRMELPDFTEDMTDFDVDDIGDGVELEGTAWNTIKSTVETVMNAIKTVISTIWNGIKSLFETIFNAIKTVVTTYFNIYKTIIETVLNVIKTVVTTVWNAIKTAVETVVNAIKTVITTAWNAIKTTTSTIFNAVKSVVTSVWNGIKSAVMNVVNTMKSGISNGFNAIKSTVSNIVNGIKSTISNVFNTIWSTVSGIVNKLKSVFNFSWSLPKIKLPHFSITGSFSLNPPSIPHFSVDWYKKAMSGGMILKDATIFGQSGGTLLGGGEAGDEAVVGVSSLRSMIQDAVSSATLSVSGDQPLINIEEMSVRSDDDIRKISQQLNTLLTAGRRAKGLV